MIDYTVVVGIDASTLKYLQVTAPSWKHFYPEMWERPWVAFFDGVPASSIREAALGANMRCIPWIGAHAQYENQREKMLSGHVYISRAIRTEWFLKIDVDAVALERTNWPDPAWFADDIKLVGPGWGYWRSKGSKYSLTEWCEILEKFGDKHFGTPRQEWAKRIGSWDHPKGPKLRDKRRWVSWLAFQRTSWVRYMADLYEREYGNGMLPVPSHDTSLWAAAVRSEAKVNVVQVKPAWTNRVSLNGCRKAVEGLNL